MPADDSIALFTFAFEREEDDKLFQRWINGGQYVNDFDTFKNELKPKLFKPEAEVFADVETILNSMKGV